MRSIILSSKPWLTQILLFVRIVIGIMMFRHGYDLFTPGAVDNMTGWLKDVNFPFPRIGAILGKLAELFGGVSLALGLFTRIFAIPAAFTMYVITFIIGNGDIFGERAYPFMLMLSYIIFFFAGPGKWSLDYYLFDRRKRSEF